MLHIMQILCTSAVQFYKDLQHNVSADGIVGIYSNIMVLPACYRCTRP